MPADRLFYASLLAPHSLSAPASSLRHALQLHTALVDLGYFPGDDDIDVFFFGEGTMNALMTMQVGGGWPYTDGWEEEGSGLAGKSVGKVGHVACSPLCTTDCCGCAPTACLRVALRRQCCEGLPETGITDEATWVKLLGPELQPKATRDLTADMMLNVPGLSILGGNKAEAEPSSTTEMQQPAADAPARPAYAELFSAAFSETVQPNGEGSLQDVQQLTVTDTVAGGSESVKLESARQGFGLAWPGFMHSMLADGLLAMLLCTTAASPLSCSWWQGGQRYCGCEPDRGAGGWVGAGQRQGGGGAQGDLHRCGICVCVCV